MSVAFVFSGQGSQYAGMGKELYEHYNVCRQTFEQAGEALGLSVTGLCFEEDARLHETEYTQPAVLTMSIACLRLIEEAGIKADYLAGLSLGEYSALVAARALDFEETAALVRKRGRFMTEAVPAGAGAMSAVMGLDRQGVQEACERAGGTVLPANYNMPGQIVIAGETAAVERAEKEVLALGAKRAVRLNVSGPFHTPLLKPAALQLEEELCKITMDELQTPVISNLTGDVISGKEEILPMLVKQIVSPVLWEDSVNRLIGLGVDTFIELGPGKTLCSFIKKISKDVRICNIEDMKSFNKTLEAL